MSELAEYIQELGGKTNEELSAVGIKPDEWRTVLQRETGDAIHLLTQLEDRARVLNEPLGWTSDDLRLQLIRWFSASYHHRGQVRKSGGFYSQHLWGAAGAAVKAGFIQSEMPSALMAHDAPEDIEEVREGRAPLFFTRLLGESDKIQRENDQIRSYVDVVTKPDIEDRDERSRVYLKALIQSLTENPRPVLVKLFDRWHNMTTLDAQKPEKQKKIAKETLDVFVPLAGILGLFPLQEELLRLCLKYLNPELLNGVDSFVGDRMARVHASEMWGQIQEKMAAFSGVHAIELEAHKAVSRWDVLPPHMTVDQATFRDFGLAGEDPFVWVAFRVGEERDILAVAQGIQSQLPGDRWQFNTSYGFDRGMSVKTVGPEYAAFGGRVFFRVNTVSQDARSHRGVFHKGGFDTPLSIVEGAKRSVQRADGGADINIVVQEELLFPTIRISTFIEGELRFLDVPHACTGRELYRILHKREPEAAQDLLLQKDPFANPLRASALKGDMDVPLPNGYTVLFT